MKNSSRTKARITLAAIVVAVLALVGVGSWAVFGNKKSDDPIPEANFQDSMNPLDTDDPLSYAVDVSDVDRESMTAVAERFVELAMTWYPGTDYNLTQAEMRASGLMTEDALAKVDSPDRPTSGYEWQLWGERKGYTVPYPHTREPMDGEFLADNNLGFTPAEVEAKFSWAADGWNSEYDDEQWIWYLAMIKDENGEWAVGGYTTETITWR